MERYAQLNRRAAVLLLRYIDLGGVDESQAETTAATGINRSDYYAAKRDLLRLGYIDRRGNLLWRPAPKNDLPPPPAAPPAAGAVEEEEHDYYAELASGMLKPRQLAMLVDNLPWSGDPREINRINSPAQKRKRQQVPALQSIVLFVTGWKITDRHAKDMLTAQSESVEDVYEVVIEVFERTQAMGKVPENPGPYLVGACRRRKPLNPPPVYQPPQAADVDPGPEPDDTFRDAKWEQQMAEQAKLRERGVDLTKPSRRWRL